MNFVELHSAVYIGHELYNEKRRENEMAKIPKSLKTQVVYRNSNSEKKKAYKDPRTHRRWDQVPKGSKHPLSTG